MIIQINEYESYNIAIPEKVTPSQFFEFKSRLDTIAKLIGKDPLLNIASAIPTIKSTSKRPRGTPPTDRFWFQNRENAVRVLKNYYKLSGYQKEQYGYENGVTKTVLKNDMILIKAKYSISPEEVGLISYPTSGNSPKFINNDNKKEDEEEEPQVATN